jgi:hypothetical protein
MSEEDKERARNALEDAIFRCLEAGMTKDDLRTEFDYLLETADDT